MSARRTELTRAAARLFAEQGYHGTSVGDLAEAMGVQKGSLYAHIESKADLLWEVAREGAAAFHGALDYAPEPCQAKTEITATSARLVNGRVGRHARQRAQVPLQLSQLRRLRAAYRARGQVRVRAVQFGLCAVDRFAVIGIGVNRRRSDNMLEGLRCSLEFKAALVDELDGGPSSRVGAHSIHTGPAN